MVMPGDPTPNGAGPRANGSEDKKEIVITLYEAGMATSAIAKSTGLTLSRVNQILKAERCAHIKRAGTDGIRVERVSELELVREHLFASLFPTNEEGHAVPPNKEAMAAYLRVVSLQGTLMGTSSAGPIYGEGALPQFAKEQMAVAAYRRGLNKPTKR
jgi:hypothetical protein